jgi:hypothetical protein
MMKALTNPQRRTLALELVRFRSHEGNYGFRVNSRHTPILKHSPELKALLKKKLIKQVRLKVGGSSRGTYLVPTDGITMEKAPCCPECGREIKTFHPLMTDSGVACNHQPPRPLI